MSYRFEVLVTGKWYDNQVFFATEEEAQRAGYNKMFHWTACDDYQVIPSDQPVNYRWDIEKGMIPVASSD